MQGRNGDTDIENRLMNKGWGRSRRKDRVGYMQRETQKLVFPYVKQIADGNVLYDSEN